MVKFGERLPSLMQKGWEQYYIDYEMLKKCIDSLSGTNPDAESADFYAKLEKEVKKMDAFVARKTTEIKKEFNAAGSSPNALSDVKSALDALRRFVGTNIIAATKIVKKHDKNAAPAVQKRDAVAALLKSSAGINAVPPFQRELEKAHGKVNKKPRAEVAIQLSTVNLGEDDEETEAGLRGLPSWLLRGAASDEGALLEAYIADWKIDSDDETTSMIKSSKIDIVANAKEIVDADAANWAVDFSSDAKKWTEMDCGEKLKTTTINLLKIGLIVAALYAFICSLSFLADGFRLVAGRQAGEIFRNSELFNNPIAGMLVGVLVTVLVQSSSTSTSISACRPPAAAPARAAPPPCASN